MLKKEKIETAAVGDTQLQYYVYDANGTFGVAISETRTHCTHGLVTGSHTHAVNLAHVLARNLVFPDSLSEILEDYNLPE